MAVKNHFGSLLERIVELGTDLMRAPRYETQFAPLVYPQRPEGISLADWFRITFRPNSEPNLIRPVDFEIDAGSYKVSIDNLMGVPRDKIFQLGIRSGERLALYLDRIAKQDDSTGYGNWGEELLKKECSLMLRQYRQFLVEYKQWWLELCRKAAIDEIQYLPKLEHYLNGQHELPEQISRTVVMAGLKDMDHLAYALSSVQEHMEQILSHRYTQDLHGYHRAIEDMRYLLKYLSLYATAKAILNSDLVGDKPKRTITAYLYHDTYLTVVTIDSYDKPFYRVDNTVLLHKENPVHWEDHYKSSRSWSWEDFRWSGMFDDITATVNRKLLPCMNLMHSLVYHGSVLRADTRRYQLYIGYHGRFELIPSPQQVDHISEFVMDE